MPLATLAILTAFLAMQGSVDPTPPGGTPKISLKGFEIMAVPKLADPLLAEPCFVPRNPKSGLAWFSAHKSENSAAAGTFKVLSFQAGQLQFESGTEFALPNGYEKILALRQPRALQIPWIGERKDWTVSIGRLPLAPLYFPPHRLSMLHRFAIGLQASDAPPASDLNRDGVPELWFLPSQWKKTTDSMQGLPELLPAPGSEPADTDAIDEDEDWTKDLSSCLSIRFWDLDEDQLEDFIAMRGKQEALTFKNASNFQLDRQDTDSGLLDQSNNAIRQNKLCLGPKRRGLQWALAYGAETEPPILLQRKGTELAFHEYGEFSKALSEFHVLDARIFDWDGDAKEELLLLIQSYPVLVPTTQPDSPQIRRRSFSRLTKVTPELRIYKLARGEARPPLLMDKGLYIPGATAIRIGDLDGDAAPDLVVTRGLQQPMFYRNVMFHPQSSHFYRLALRGPVDWRHAIGSYIDLYNPDTEDRLARFRWPPLYAEDQPLLWVTFELDNESDLAGVLINWADGQAFPLEDLERGQYRFEKR